jgi:hypothetical protein
MSLALELKWSDLAGGAEKKFTRSLLSCLLRETSFQPRHCNDPSVSRLHEFLGKWIQEIMNGLFKFIAEF